jgi:hypothetical protein
MHPTFDILPALKGKDSHGTAPLSWDVYGLLGVNGNHQTKQQFWIPTA